MEALDDVRERELNRLIERRADATPDPDELEESYMESVRRHRAKRRKENRAAWHAFHLDQAERARRTLEALITHHEAQAMKLLGGSPTEGEA